MNGRTRSLFAVALAVLCHVAPAHAQFGPVAGRPSTKTGLIKRHPSFPSRLVEPRLVEVWLPPGYMSSGKSYPVLYVQDGQNAFDDSTAFGGVEWGIDEAMTRLIESKRIHAAIVVAISNTPKRFQEYMPRKALTDEKSIRTGIEQTPSVEGPALSDAYLRFLTTELKPFIDRTYRTKRERDDTFLMGSSMGGLISLYAVTELPGVFGGAACLSTHWPAGDGAMVEYLRTHVPKANDHRLYFDHGTATLDSLYAPFQNRVNELLRANKYEDGEHFRTQVFDGADHSERSWRARVEVPLEFLLRR